MTNEEQPSLREIKRQKTLEAIEDCATKLVLERGVDAVTVEDICADAGISKRTFFNYVDSKEAAIMGAGLRAPSAQESEAFLEKKHDCVFDAAFDLVVCLFGNHDNSAHGKVGEIIRRRNEIRADNPELAMQHFLRFHKNRHDIEDLITAYLERWPASQRLPDTPRNEAIAMVGVAVIAVFQGSRTWHEMTNPSQSDFNDCCQRALDNIFLLKRAHHE